MSNSDNFSVLSAVDDISVAEFISDAAPSSSKARKVIHAVKNVKDLWALAKMVKDARHKEELKTSFNPMSTD